MADTKAENLSCGSSTRTGGSTGEAVQVILDGMTWLRPRADEGLYYPTRRYDRYREVLGQMRVSGHV